MLDEDKDRERVINGGGACRRMVRMLVVLMNNVDGGNED